MRERVYEIEKKSKQKQAGKSKRILFEFVLAEFLIWK